MAPRKTNLEDFYACLKRINREKGNIRLELELFVDNALFDEIIQFTNIYHDGGRDFMNNCLEIYDGINILRIREEKI